MNLVSQIKRRMCAIEPAPTHKAAPARQGESAATAVPEPAKRAAERQHKRGLAARLHAAADRMFHRHRHAHHRDASHGNADSHHAEARAETHVHGHKRARHHRHHRSKSPISQAPRHVYQSEPVPTPAPIVVRPRVPNSLYVTRRNPVPSSDASLTRLYGALMLAWARPAHHFGSLASMAPAVRGASAGAVVMAPVFWPLAMITDVVLWIAPYLPKRFAGKLFLPARPR